MHGSRIRFAFALAVLSVSVTAVAYAAAPGLTFTTTAIRSTVANEFAPATDARYVAYQRFFFLDTPANNDVWVYDLSQATAHAVTTNVSEQLNPDVSYDLVVYDDSRHGNREIYLYDINEDSEVRITTKAGDQFRPRISNRTIVWYDAATGSLWYRDLMSDSAREIPNTTGVGNADFWDIDGDTVVLTIGDSLQKWPVGTDMGPQEVLALGFSDSFDSLRTHAGQAAVTISGIGGLDVAAVSLADGSISGIDVILGRESSAVDIFDRNVIFQHDMAGNENLAFAYLGGGAGWDNVGATSDDETDPALFGRRVVFRRPGMTLGTDLHLSSATPETARTSGTDRYQTAIETSKAYFDSASSAVICTGRNFPDALAAAPLAKALEAPLLLVPGDELTSGVLEELTRLDVKHVWIIGGEDVISPGVAEELAAGRFSTRIAGADRYETAQAIAFRFYDLVTMSQGLPWTGYAFIARGDAFPDALAVAPVAASLNAPVLLTKTGSLPSSTALALDHIYTTHPVVVGGSDVVSDAVKNEIQTITQTAHAASPTQRWQGPDRYATAIDIVSRALAENWIDLDTLGIATGRNFPDALGGGAALASYGSPLLLVKTDEIPPPLGTFMNEHGWDIGRIDIFGGSDVVTEEVRAHLGAYQE